MAIFELQIVVTRGSESFLHLRSNGYRNTVLAKIEKKVPQDNPWTNTDFVCEFQPNRFSRFRKTSKNVYFRAKKVDDRENITK